MVKQIAGQVFAFLEQYGNVYGDLLEPAQFNDLAAKLETASSESDYRDFVAHVKAVCRHRWTTFDNGFMVLGMTLLFCSLIMHAKEFYPHAAPSSLILWGYCMGPLSRSFLVHQVR